MNRPLAVLLPPLVALLPALALVAQKATPDLFAASRQARANGRFGMLLRQFRADEPALGEHHEAGAKPATAVYQGARDVPAGFWVWQQPYWFVFRDGPGTAPEKRRWGTEAACGAPDTPAAGDQDTAWATREQDAKGEWLLLEYSTPVRVTSIEVHENFNPGAVVAVAILTPQGEELELWRNHDVKAPPDAARILQIDIPLGFEVERVKLTLASEAIVGWNEIDAVGLRDDKGKVHWADRATASSTYADAVAPAAPVAAGAPVRLGVFQPMARVPVVQMPVVQMPIVQMPIVPVPIAPVPVDRGALPRLVLQAPPLQVWPRAGAIEPLQIAWPAANGAEKEQLQKRVAELEAKVKELEAELARAKAAK